MIIFLHALAILAQLVAIATGAHALAHATCQRCWVAVALSVVLAIVTLIAALILLIDMSAPRLEFGLAPALMLASGIVFSLLHRAIRKIKESVC